MTEQRLANRRTRCYCPCCGNWWMTPIYAAHTHQCPLCHCRIEYRQYDGNDADLADAPINFARTGEGS